jgi:glutathione S-transferase
VKLYAFSPSSRVVGISALIEYMNLPCERVSVDLSRGEHLSDEYRALNPNHKSPCLVDDEFVLWEGNAILSYLAAHRPESGLWPSEPRAQADVVRWLVWEAAHLDAESWGMVAFEKASKMVLGLGAPDPAFIARGEQNFRRFADVLNQSLMGRRWLVGDALTVADFAVGQVVPSASRLELSVDEFPEILRWYDGLSALAAWKSAITNQQAAVEALIASMPRRQS